MVDFQVDGARPQDDLPVTPFHVWTFPDGSSWTHFFRTPAGYLLRFPELADFVVSRDGGDVRARPAPGVSAETISHLFMNQVLPLALSKIGKLVLHASAVEVHGLGVAFIGQSGLGKSTLAASFATNGFRFLTDDGLVTERRGGDFWLEPNHPSIRLWDDSQDALIPADAEIAPSVQFTTKGRFLAGSGVNFCSEPRKLSRMYFLGSGQVDRVKIAPLPASEAMIELVKHSFLLDIEEREMLSRNFQEISSLASRRICFALDYPRSFDHLLAVREAIEEHVSLTLGAT